MERMKCTDKLALRLELLNLNRSLDQGMWNLEVPDQREKFEELCRRQLEIKSLLEEEE